MNAPGPYYWQADRITGLIILMLHTFYGLIF